MGLLKLENSLRWSFFTFKSKNIKKKNKKKLIAKKNL